jgi:hypothetical protein
MRNTTKITQGSLLFNADVIPKLHSVHDRMINGCGAVGGIRIVRGKRNTQKILASATLSTTSPT